MLLYMGGCPVPGPAPVRGGSHSRSLSHGKRSRPGHVPMGGGHVQVMFPLEEVPFQVLFPTEEVPIQGPAPMGRGYVQVTFPWEEVTFRSCSHRRSSRPGHVPMGGGPVRGHAPDGGDPIQGPAPMGRGPVLGPAPMGGGYVQALLPWKEVPFQSLCQKKTSGTRVNHFFHFFRLCRDISFRIMITRRFVLGLTVILYIYCTLGFNCGKLLRGLDAIFGL